MQVDKKNNYSKPYLLKQNSKMKGKRVEKKNANTR